MFCKEGEEEEKVKEELGRNHRRFHQEPLPPSLNPLLVCLQNPPALWPPSHAFACSTQKKFTTTRVSHISCSVSLPVGSPKFGPGLYLRPRKMGLSKKAVSSRGLPRLRQNKVDWDKKHTTSPSCGNQFRTTQTKR